MVVLYEAAVILACISLGLLFALTWRYRHINGGTAMLSLIIAVFLWSLFSLLETTSETYDMQMVFFKLGYLGLMTIPPAWLLFTVNYTSSDNGLKRLRALPFLIYPLIVVVHLWTGAWGDNFINFGTTLVNYDEFMIIEKTYGPLFWVSAAHNYILVLTGSLILVVRLFMRRGLMKKQAVALLIAVILPVGWNVFYTFVPVGPHKDFTPVFFAISAILIVLGILRYNLFMIKPFAREYIINSMRDGILVFDIRNRLIEANPAAVKFLRLSEKHIGAEGMSIATVAPIIQKFALTDNESIELTIPGVRDKRFMHIDYGQMRDSRQNMIGMLMTLTDVTEHKHMEQQMNAQDRLASIGELTSGVAHELNNPLMIIKGMTELLLDSEIPESTKDDVSVINDEVDRASSIVKNLLTFARRQPGDKDAIDINETITKTIALRSYAQRVANIQTVIDLTPNIPKVQGNELQLRQVLLNLIVNAEFFIKEKNEYGKLTIVTKKTSDSVMIKVIDTGPGISEERLEHIFEPFYTTKDVGQGTGLGLSICHGIVTEHGGTIDVESSPGKGATFTITLPAMANSPKEMPDDFYQHQLPLKEEIEDAV